MKKRLLYSFIMSLMVCIGSGIGAAAAYGDPLTMDKALDHLLIQPLTVPEKSLTLLERVLKSHLAQYDGSWSVYVKDLTIGQSLIINDQPMKSASVMKLFILGACYDAIRKGDLVQSDEVRARMSSMISASSNTDTNVLISALGNGSFSAGVSYVNRYIRDNGYSDGTHLYNGFQDDSLILHADKINQTTAVDVGTFLEKVYTRSLDRRAVCNEIEEMMLAQQTRYKIPKLLPENVLVANKTGETDTTENDTALIYTSQGDYILCIFSNDWSDSSLAQTRIGELSYAVYEYFCDEDYVRHTFGLR